MNVLDTLLKMDIQDLPEKEYNVTRLSKICREPVIFKLRALSYNRVQELHKNTEDVTLHILLAGVVEPNFGDDRLREKYDAIVPPEVVKKMLLPGEIDEISARIEALSGYRRNVTEEVKKN